MSALLDQMEARAVDLAYAKGRRPRLVSSFTLADIGELVALEASGKGLLGKSWVHASRRIDGPVAGFGFAGAAMPNTEPVNAPTAVTGVTAETNLYTPATGANADWALLPQGSIRAPQAWVINAAGIITSSAGSQTAVFTSRIGTSATSATNQSLGVTGAIALGSTITNALWYYEGLMTIRGVGTSATAVCHGVITVSQQAAGAATTSAVGMSGNTTATFDATQQQGFVISVTPSATGVSTQLTQFVLMAID